VERIRPEHVLREDRLTKTGGGSDCGEIADKGTIMRSRGIGIWLSIGLIVGFWGGLRAQDASPQDRQGVETEAFKDEPQARALYDRMIEAFRRPQSLSYRSEYRWEAKGRPIGHCFYTAGLKIEEK